LHWDSFVSPLQHHGIDSGKSRCWSSPRSKGLNLAFSHDHIDNCHPSLHSIRKSQNYNPEQSLTIPRNKQLKPTSHPSPTSPQHLTPSRSLATYSLSADAPTATTAPSTVPGPKISQLTSSNSASGTNAPSLHPASPLSKTYGSGIQTV